MLISTDFNWIPKLSTLNNSINFSLQVSAGSTQHLLFYAGASVRQRQLHWSRKSLQAKCCTILHSNESVHYFRHVIYFHKQDKICHISAKFQILLHTLSITNFHIHTMLNCDVFWRIKVSNFPSVVQYLKKKHSQK